MQSCAKCSRLSGETRCRPEDQPDVRFGACDAPLARRPDSVMGPGSQSCRCTNRFPDGPSQVDHREMGRDTKSKRDQQMSATNSRLNGPLQCEEDCGRGHVAEVAHDLAGPGECLWGEAQGLGDTVKNLRPTTMHEKAIQVVPRDLHLVEKCVQGGRKTVPDQFGQLPTEIHLESIVGHRKGQNSLGSLPEMFPCGEDSGQTRWTIDMGRHFRRHSGGLHNQASRTISKQGCRNEVHQSAIIRANRQTAQVDREDQHP